MEAWVNRTAYALGDECHPSVATGRTYRCVRATGASSRAEPDWPVVTGAMVPDALGLWHALPLDITATVDAGDSGAMLRGIESPAASLRGD